MTSTKWGKNFFTTESFMPLGDTQKDENSFNAKAQS